MKNIFRIHLHTPVLVTLLLVCLVISCSDSGSDDTDNGGTGDNGGNITVDQGKFTWDGTEYTAAYSGITRDAQTGKITKIYAPAHTYAFEVQVWDPPAVGTQGDVDIQPLDSTAPTVLLATSSYLTSWTSVSGSVSTSAVTGGVKCSFTLTMSNQGITAPLTGYIIAYEQ